MLTRILVHTVQSIYAKRSHEAIFASLCFNKQRNCSKIVESIIHKLLTSKRVIYSENISELFRGHESLKDSSCGCFQLQQEIFTERTVEALGETKQNRGEEKESVHLKACYKTGKNRIKE